MFTRNLSAMLMSIGLLAFVGLAGCKSTKCNTCSTCGQGYAQSYMAAPYSYGSPQPTSPYGYGPVQEYQIVPENQLQQQRPTPAPPVPQQRTVPPSKLESFTPNGLPRSSASFQRPLGVHLQTQANRQYTNTYGPIMEPTASERKLVPRTIKKPGFFQPVGKKVRHVLGTMRDRLPKLGKKKNQQIQATRYVVPGRRQALVVSNPGIVLVPQQQYQQIATQQQYQQVATQQQYQQVASPVAPMPRRRGQIAVQTRPSPIVRTQPRQQNAYQTQTQNTRDPFVAAPSWNTQQINQQSYQQYSGQPQSRQLSQQRYSEVAGTAASSTNRSIVAASNPSGHSAIPMWPHAKQQPTVSAATPASQPFSTVPPQGLGQ